jgi:hypothetical protein
MPVLSRLSRLMKNGHLPFDRPFGNLRVLSSVEGLMALSNVEGLRFLQAVLVISAVMAGIATVSVISMGERFTRLWRRRRRPGAG